MPVLARIIEATGIATVTVTMMPDLAEKYRLSRILGVEFPFGHAYGMPGDVAMQREVCEAALDLLATATSPGTRRDLAIAWPVDPKIAYRDWQPAEPSPIVAAMMRRNR